MRLKYLTLGIIILLCARSAHSATYTIDKREYVSNWCTNPYNKIAAFFDKTYSVDEPVCTAEYVDHDMILTARHCIEDSAPDSFLIANCKNPNKHYAVQPIDVGRAGEVWSINDWALLRIQDPNGFSDDYFEIQENVPETTNIMNAGWGTIRRLSDQELTTIKKIVRDYVKTNKDVALYPLQATIEKQINLAEPTSRPWPKQLKANTRCAITGSRKEYYHCYEFTPEANSLEEQEAIKNCNNQFWATCQVQSGNSGGPYFLGNKIYGLVSGGGINSNEIRNGNDVKSTEFGIKTSSFYNEYTDAVQQRTTATTPASETPATTQTAPVQQTPAQKPDDKPAPKPTIPEPTIVEDTPDTPAKTPGEKPAPAPTLIADTPNNTSTKKPDEKPAPAPTIPEPTIIEDTPDTPTKTPGDIPAPAPTLIADTPNNTSTKKPGEKPAPAPTIPEPTIIEDTPDTPAKTPGEKPAPAPTLIADTPNNTSTKKPDEKPAPAPTIPEPTIIEDTPDTPTKTPDDIPAPAPTLIAEAPNNTPAQTVTTSVPSQTAVTQTTNNTATQTNTTAPQTPVATATVTEAEITATENAIINDVKNIDNASLDDVLNLVIKMDNLKQLQERYERAKARETSTANKILGAAAIGVTGIGGMMLASGLAEQNADKAAEQDMKAYLATFRCDYGRGRNIMGGETGVQLPNTPQLSGMKTEYTSLATELKAIKNALSIRPGIESELVLNSAETGLYDDVSIGSQKGAFTSLARALMDEDSADAAEWKSQKQSAKKKTTAGGITAGVGAVGGAVGNLIINRDKDDTDADKKDTFGTVQ